MKHLRKSVALTALIGALGMVGCGGDGGGGGGSSPTPSARSAAEGGWCGTASNGYTETLFALDDGSVWGIYGSGNCNSGVTSAIGAYHGTYSESNGNVSGSISQFDFSASRTSSASFSGTATAKSKFSIALSDANKTTLNANYLGSYDQPASSTALAGRFTGTAISSVDYASLQQSVTISGTTLTMPADPYGCSASGTVTPHATPRATVGVFDLTIKFNGSYCSLGNGTTAKGMAMLTASNQLQAMAFVPGTTRGIFFVGNR